MKTSIRQNSTRWVIISASFVIVVLILWNTYSFFQVFKVEERIKMEHWAEAQKTIENAPIEADIELPLKIIRAIKIPIIVTQNDSIVNQINIDDNIIENADQLKRVLFDLEKQNYPIKQEYFPGKFQYLYYGDSELLNKLKYYPVALLLVILLFLLLIYNFYRSTKIASQNKLWTGMAKETAHQIGTPLSSLIGWVEIMKMDHVAQTTIIEIEKDIARLQTITDRFSKIGSEPALETLDLIEETKRTFDYLQSRFSKQVSFSFEAPNLEMLVSINSILHSWTIENLVKNAIDAMKGKGNLDLKIVEENNNVAIYVSDTGKGISRKVFKNIFEPGFTTKKRGWGLGLSLTKRIVEEYHKGKINVHWSAIDKGTTIKITFKRL